MQRSRWYVDGPVILVSLLLIAACVLIAVDALWVAFAAMVLGAFSVLWARHRARTR